MEDPQPVIPRELEVKILRLHAVEKWPVGTIASQLGVHHDVVERVLKQAGGPTARPARPTGLDPFIPFITETWAKYPKLPSSRLWAMCRERGYGGHKDHFRHVVAPIRPRPVAEAFLRLRTLPGEQSQFDWAHFGKVRIGRAERPLVAFVGTLSWSRALYLRYYLGQQGENFLRGQEAAFARWGGSTRVALYDNFKTAVLERIGDAVRFNPTLLDFAAHYRFEPRPVAPCRGNEKGRVERAIRYVRASFFLARSWRTLEDLNAQAEQWCMGEAMDRPWPEDPTRTVRDAFTEEKGKLLPLPETPFPCDERRELRVGKTPYVRFDGNDYSVPHGLVRKALVCLATLDAVRVFDGLEEVARHGRSFDRGQQVEDQAHVAALVEAKRAARKHRGLDRLAHAAPSARALIERLALRGENLGSATHRLLDLLDAYGAEHLEAALREVLSRDAIHVHAVRQVLERERRARGLPPALPIPLPDDPRVRAITIRPHALDGYDRLARSEREPDRTEEPEPKKEDDHGDDCAAAVPA